MIKYIRLYLCWERIPKKGVGWLISTIKRICSAFTTVCVVLAVILAILLAGVRLVGIEPYVVLSGSMEPKYHVGSLIYTVKVDPADLEVGHAITFMLNPTTVATHEIIEVIPDDKDPSVIWFRTQGIANEDPDGEPVCSTEIIGKPIFTIPLLGYFTNYIQHPPGLFVAVGVGAFIILMAFLPDFLPEDDTNHKKTQKETQEESL